MAKKLEALSKELADLVSKITAAQAKFDAFTAGGTGATPQGVSILAALSRQIDALTVSKERLLAVDKASNAETAKTLQQVASVSNIIPAGSRSADQAMKNAAAAKKATADAIKLSAQTFQEGITAKIPPNFAGGANKILADMTKGFGDLNTVISEFGLNVTSSVVEGNLRINASLTSTGGAVQTVTGEYNKLGQSVKAALQTAAVANEQFSKAFALAKGAGYGPRDLANINRRGTSGVHELQFRKQNEETQIRERLDIYVDKLGNVIPDISRQFKTFSQGIMRNTRELLKWTVAMALIYTPLNKMNELFELMIVNETKLAEAMIAVNISVATTSQVFDGVYDSAKRAGEGVSGTLDAFTQAYRASGRLGDSTERFDKSLILLDDSLTLSKLSTLDQAGAIDTLSAALYQSNLSLDEGGILLDKWVHVSKSANVDLAALSTGFSILGNSAEAAGLGVDELNGLIAAISTTTGVMASSGVAAVAKALVGNYTTPIAVKELDRIGISVRNLAGENKGYLEVMRELAEMNKLDLIPDVGRVTSALGGGGVRRQKDVAALLENFALVDEITRTSQQAGGGTAQSALAMQLDTVQTASIRLSNAFQKLANDLGNEGGVLDGMSSLLNVGTTLVEVFSSLANVLGKAGPALLALGLASAYVGRRQEGTLISSILFGPNRANKGRTLFSQTRFGQGLSGWARTNLGGVTTTTTPISRAPTGGFTSPEGKVYGAGQFVPKGSSITSSTFGGMTLAGKSATGLAMGLLPAIGNVQEGDYIEAGADIAGGLLGAIIGGSAIWAIVGVAIAEAFVRTAITYDTEFAKFFPENIVKRDGRYVNITDIDEDDDDISDLTVSERRDAATKGMFETVGGGTEWLGRLTSWANSGLFNLQGAREDTGELIGGETAAGLLLKENAPEQYAEYRREQAAINALTGGFATPDYQKSSAFAELQKSIVERDKGLVSALTGKTRENLLNELVQGDIKASEFTTKTDELGAFGVKYSKFLAQFGEELMSLSGDINSVEDTYEAFMTIAIDGTSEQTTRVTALISEIQMLQSHIDNWVPGNVEIPIMINGEEVLSTISEIEARIVELNTQGASILESAFREITYQKVKVPGIVGDVNEPQTVEDVQKIIAGARRKQEKDLSTYYTADQYGTFIDRVTPFRVPTGEGFTTVEGIDKKYYAAEQIRLQESREIAGKGMNVQQIDLDSSQRGELDAALAWAGDLLSGIPGYELDEEKMGIIYSDYITDILHADNLQMRLALQKLVDIGQKQLDGMYNIPEGATFMVPLTAASYGRGKNALSGEGESIAGDLLSGTGLGKDPKTDIINKYLERVTRKDTSGYQEPKTAIIDKYLERVTKKDGRMEGPEMYGPYLWELEQQKGSYKDGALGKGYSGNPLYQFDAARDWKEQVTPPTLMERLDVAPVTNLELSITSTSYLLLDGRVVATVVKSYLEADLLRAETSAITKNIVI